MFFVLNNKKILSNLLRKTREIFEFLYTENELIFCVLQIFIVRYSTGQSLDNFSKSNQSPMPMNISGDPYTISFERHNRNTQG